MDQIQIYFLEAMKASLLNKKVHWDSSLTDEEYMHLFEMAQIHNVVPMIYEAVADTIPAEYRNHPMISGVKNITIRTVVVQTMKTNEFLKLYKHMTDEGLHPFVVKGIVCRNVYPQPDYRVSSDEDVKIDPVEYEHAHQVLTEYGMVTTEANRESVYEVPYTKPKTPLYIELHKSLFPPESDAYGDLNRYFENPELITMNINGTDVCTLGYTDHLFYLITHALKHFMHSGFGIRQVCDIIMFANAYGNQIDWNRFYTQCEEINALYFTNAVFTVGEKYLVFDRKKSCIPEEWFAKSVDETLFLEDLLDAGVFGDSSMSRKHSSTMTLSAVSSQKTGKKTNGLLATVFPSASALKGKYTYLEDKPYLLPVAWTQRILKYRSETKKVDNNDAGSSIEIANQRIALMKQMGIVEDPKKSR